MKVKFINCNIALSSTGQLLVFNAENALNCMKIWLLSFIITNFKINCYFITCLVKLIFVLGINLLSNHKKYLKIKSLIKWIMRTWNFDQDKKTFF